nr:MAG TPA: hypothetical protein [Bacteriophage sp.]
MRKVRHICIPIISCTIFKTKSDYTGIISCIPTRVITNFYKPSCISEFG